MATGIKNAVAFGAKALLWLMTVLGSFIIVMSLVQMFMLATGLKSVSVLLVEGPPPTFPEAIGDATFGVALAAISSILRGAIGRWQGAPANGTQA